MINHKELPTCFLLLLTQTRPDEQTLNSLSRKYKELGYEIIKPFNVIEIKQGKSPYSYFAIEVRKES